MTELSITRAWNEAMAFLRREFGLVFLIAFLLICLPGAALQYAMPMADAPDPANVDEAFAQIRTMLMFFPLVLVLALIGTIAINHLAIVPRASVGEALAVGARRFFILLLATILIGLVGGIVVLPVMVLVGLGSGGATLAPGPLLLILLVFLILALALSVKLLLLTPVAAAERGGPVALIARSWALTRGHFWKLLGFQILFWLVASVLIMVTSLVAALVLTVTLGSPLEPGAAFFALNLISAGLQALVSLAFATTVARIYAQLTGAGDREIFA